MPYRPFLAPPQPALPAVPRPNSRPPRLAVPAPPRRILPGLAVPPCLTSPCHHDGAAPAAPCLARQCHDSRRHALPAMSNVASPCVAMRCLPGQTKPDLTLPCLPDRAVLAPPRPAEPCLSLPALPNVALSFPRCLAMTRPSTHDSPAKPNRAPRRRGQPVFRALPCLTGLAYRCHRHHTLPCRPSHTQPCLSNPRLA